MLVSYKVPLNIQMLSSYPTCSFIFDRSNREDEQANLGDKREGKKGASLTVYLTP